MKIKAIAACGNGMGSSQMIKMKINKVFKRLGIDAEIGHMSVGEAKGVANNYDMIFVSETFTSQFRPGKDTKVVGLKNLLSEKEIEAKIREAFTKKLFQMILHGFKKCRLQIRQDLIISRFPSMNRMRD